MNLHGTLANLRDLSALIKDTGLSEPGSSASLCDKCETMIVSPEIIEGCIKLFRDGHNSLAVETAFKIVNNYVKSKSGLTSIDGMSLMQSALSVTNPKIKLNKLQTTSEKDEQIGYMNILGGCMTGIRNPRAHEDDYRDTDRNTYDLLVLADHLLRKLRSS